MVRSKASGRSAKSIDEHVGERLRSAREAISETPETLALVMGVSVETYERIERGEERPAAEALHLASLLLNVPITYFFTGFATEDTSTSSADEDCA
jgi:transcriptional regulator with XRE-family HTH domain